MEARFHIGLRWQSNLTRRCENKNHRRVSFPGEPSCVAAPFYKTDFKSIENLNWKIMRKEVLHEDRSI